MRQSFWERVYLQAIASGGPILGMKSVGTEGHTLDLALAGRQAADLADDAVQRLEKHRQGAMRDPEPRVLTLETGAVPGGGDGSVYWRCDGIFRTTAVTAEHPARVLEVTCGNVIIFEANDTRVRAATAQPGISFGARLRNEGDAVQTLKVELTGLFVPVVEM